MVSGGKINRRGAESVSAQTCLGELDDVLVAMRDGAIDELVSVLFGPVDAVDHGSRPAITGVERASRLPGITERAARGGLPGHRAMLPSAVGLVTPRMKAIVVRMSWALAR
jgi:hypothetical protein